MKNKHIIFSVFFAFAFISISLASEGRLPIVTIDKPEDFSELKAGEEIIFEGNAYIMFKGKLPEESLIWRSNIKGFLGKGSKLKVSDLSVGDHLIILKAISPERKKSLASIYLTIYKEKVEPVEKKVKELKPIEEKLVVIEPIKENKPFVPEVSVEDQIKKAIDVVRENIEDPVERDYKKFVKKIRKKRGTDKPKRKLIDDTSDSSKSSRIKVVPEKPEEGMTDKEIDDLIKELEDLFRDTPETNKEKESIGD